MTHKFGGLKHSADNVDKPIKIKFPQQLAEWNRRYAELSVRLTATEYHNGVYAKDLFLEAARLAAQLLKLQWTVEVDSFATIAIETAANEIEVELRTWKVLYSLSPLAVGHALENSPPNP